MVGSSMDALRRLDKAAVFRSVGYVPHAGQAEVHASNAPRRVVACGVRWGKTTCAVHEALCGMLAPSGPSRGWIVSPTFDTSDLVVRDLFAVLEHHLSHRLLELDRRGRRAVVRNLAGHPAEVAAKSATRPAALLGASLDWVVIDEAARLKPDIWSAHVSQRLVDRRGWALIASTPREKDDWFHEEFQRGQTGEPGYASWTRPTWDNPAISKDVIDAEKERLERRVFYTEYGGEFIGDAGRVCPVCHWGEVINGRILSGEQWARCRSCDECERPLDEDGKPVGMLDANGRVMINVYYEAGRGEVHIHFDPVLGGAELTGGLG